MAKAEQENKTVQLNSALADFKCAKNIDIENFLHTKAIVFQKQSLCSVYLICDEEALDNGIISVQGYFTLSHKAIIIPTENSNVSKSKRGDIMKNRDAELLNFVLIGQLGKYIVQNDDGTYTATEVTGAEILDIAKEVIYAANDIIAFRSVLVECEEDNDYLNSFYKSNGFKFLQNEEFNQYYFIL